MDLIGGYLLVLLVLFASNISLLFGNYTLNKVKILILSLVFAAVTFIILYTSNYLNTTFLFLLDYLSYLFLLIVVIIFTLMIYYIKTDEFKIPLYSVIIMYLVSTILISSQTTLEFSSCILYSLFVLVILFVVYQLTKLLHHAKRQYAVIVGEYMSLFSVLFFIFFMTYDSTRTLDYSMFSSFLILTPTYQLIYVIIGIVAVLVIGVLINDKGGNS